MLDNSQLIKAAQPQVKKQIVPGHVQKARNYGYVKPLRKVGTAWLYGDDSVEGLVRYMRTITK